MAAATAVSVDDKLAKLRSDVDKLDQIRRVSLPSLTLCTGSLACRSLRLSFSADF
jgi:hypothetical protein